MKKKYIYFAPPLLALALFIVYYLHFRTGYEAKQEAIAATQQQAKDEQIRIENTQRQRAVDDAMLSQKKHKEEKAAREAFLEKRRQDRQASYDARDKALSDLQKYRDKAEKLRKDVADIKEEITKVEQDEVLLREQVKSFHDLAQKAVENDNSLTAVLEKIQKADEARAAAAKAAAAKKS